MGAVLEVGSEGSGPTQKQRKVNVGPGKHGVEISKAMTYRAPPAGVPHFVPALTVPHNGLQNGEMEPLLYRTAPRSHRLPLGRVDGESGDMGATGQQLTPELGKT